MMRIQFLKRGRLHRATYMAGAAALAFTLAGAAAAQTATAAADEKAEDAAEIVVTGTSIRGVAPIGSPLIGVDQE